MLPSLANRVPNINEIHTALLLYCFLETGLLNALVEVVVSADTFLSVRATVLIGESNTFFVLLFLLFKCNSNLISHIIILGKLLQLMHTHLPADICKTSSALPTLVSHATQGNHQAMAAISALQSLHHMLKNRPAACSMFLDLIIQSGSKCGGCAAFLAFFFIVLIGFRFSFLIEAFMRCSLRCVSSTLRLFRSSYIKLT